jgi:protein-S-isoprenylcysteine O-methyltransferase Ste14
MIIAFVIWTVISLVLAGIGIRDWNAGKAVGFFTGTRPPEVEDVRAYNHDVARLWFGYAAVFELLGIPFLFLKQNSALLVPFMMGIPVITIALMVIYHRILQKHRKPYGEKGKTDGD